MQYGRCFQLKCKTNMYSELPVLQVKGVHKALEQSVVSSGAVQHLFDEAAVCLRCHFVVTKESFSVSVQAQLAWVKRHATPETGLH